MDAYYLVAAVVFSVICYKMAENKGRNPALGAVAGFLFNIFAVIYYLMVESSYEYESGVNNHETRKSNSNDGKSKRDGTKKCPKCDGEIKDEAIKCKHCKQDLRKLKKITETKCECQACGNVWFYGKEEVSANRRARCHNASRQIACCGGCMSSGGKKKVKNLGGKCSKCGSKAVDKKKVTHHV